jgi:dienelactone hydrolase
MGSQPSARCDEKLVQVHAEDVRLDGNLAIPTGAEGIVVFAHGSGSSRLSPRNRCVAESLREEGLATLLFDLLTSDEDEADRLSRHLRFDVDLLAKRLVGATDWLREQPDTRDLSLGYFGASTGSAAALTGARERPDVVRAVVSRGGRPDLVEPLLARVKAPTLLIVGGDDEPVVSMNRSAFECLTCEKMLEVVPGATHLFEEPGALEQVAQLAGEWFRRWLTR